jgi:hypothetical protein
MQATQSPIRSKSWPSSKLCLERSPDTERLVLDASPGNRSAGDAVGRADRGVGGDLDRLDALIADNPGQQQRTSQLRQQAEQALTAIRQLADARFRGDAAADDATEAREHGWPRHGARPRRCG